MDNPATPNVDMARGRPVKYTHIHTHYAVIPPSGTGPDFNTPSTPSNQPSRNPRGRPKIDTSSRSTPQSRAFMPYGRPALKVALRSGLGEEYKQGIPPAPTPQSLAAGQAYWRRRSSFHPSPDTSLSVGGHSAADGAVRQSPDSGFQPQHDSLDRDASPHSSRYPAPYPPVSPSPLAVKRRAPTQNIPTPQLAGRSSLPRSFTFPPLLQHAPPQSLPCHSPFAEPYPPPESTSDFVTDAEFTTRPSSCTVCGSTAFVPRSPEELRQILNSPVERVMSVLRSAGVSLGEFLVELLETDPKLLSQSARVRLSSFLNCDNPNHRPDKVVELLHRHRYGRDFGQNGRLVYPIHTPPTYSHRPQTSQPTEPPSPPTTGPASATHPPSITSLDTPDPAVTSTPDSSTPLPSNSAPEAAHSHSSGRSKKLAHEVLDHWAVRTTIDCLEREVATLVKLDILRTAGQEALSWNFLLSFNLSSLEDKMIETAPVLWSILTSVAVGKERRMTQDSEGLRDPWVGSLFALLMLINFRNSRCNLLQSVIGVLLFSCNTHRTIYSILGRSGITVSYSTTLDRLKSLAQDSKKTIKAVGYDAFTGERDAAILYDNINSRQRAWQQTLAFRDVTHCGTAATILLLDDVPEGAFDPVTYYRRRTDGRNLKLTVERLLEDVAEREGHIPAMGIGLILRILLRYVPALAKHKASVNTFKTSHAVHPLRSDRKTEFFPMQSSAIDEATTSGNKDILRNLLVEQLGLSPEQVAMRLWAVCGDQLTIARIRQLVKYVTKDAPGYDQHRFALPIVQLWHKKWAFLKGIYRCHFEPVFGKGVFGLRRDASALHRNINPIKCDFYPSHRMVEVRFESLVLHAVRTLLLEDRPLALPSLRPDLSLLEELDAHFGASGHMADCTFNALEDLARRVERRFLSTAAVDAALMSDRNEDIYGRRPSPHPTMTTPATIPTSTVPSTNQPTSTLYPTEVESPAEASLDIEEERDNTFDSEDPLAGDLGEEPIDFEGDRVLWNTLLFMRDASWYLEMNYAIREGDTGRVLEVIKRLRFWFWGAGSTNYGNELLVQALDFLYHFTDDLRTAVLNNILVNPSGLSGHWHELDLLQEHLNFWIKAVFNLRNLDFDSPFLKEAISLNIAAFTDLHARLLQIFGLASQSQGHSEPNLTADINTLGEHYLQDEVLTFVAGRTQPYRAHDAFEAGIDKLDGGQLETFLAGIKASIPSDSGSEWLRFLIVISRSFRL